MAPQSFLRPVAAVVAAVAAVGVLTASPQLAAAQLPAPPTLPTLPTLPNLMPPLAPAPAPRPVPVPQPAPVLPTVPPLPTLPPPPARPAPQSAPFPGLELPPALQGKEVVPRKIGGFDFEPPSPIEGMTAAGDTFTVQSDSTKLIGNVKLSYVQIDTAQGARPAIRIDADRVELDNLRVRFPGHRAGVSDMWQRTAPGVITTLNGNFHIVISKMTVTSQIAGVTLPIPITIDASWAPEHVRGELSKAGAGLPDELSNLMVVLDGTMETYYISADDLVAAKGMSIKP